MELTKENLVGALILVLVDKPWITTNVLHVPAGCREVIGGQYGLRLGTYSVSILAICTADFPDIPGIYEWDGTKWADAPNAVMNLVARGRVEQLRSKELPTKAQCLEAVEELNEQLLGPSVLETAFPRVDIGPASEDREVPPYTANLGAVRKLAIYRNAAAEEIEPEDLEAASDFLARLEATPPGQLRPDGNLAIGPEVPIGNTGLVMQEIVPPEEK